MKILHCCLAAAYHDNHSYQENILPKMHKLQGLEVKIIASTLTYLNNAKLGFIEPSTYINENNIQVTRLPYKKFLPHFIMEKLRMYNGILGFLEDYRPDIIFIHDTQFLGAIDIIKYLKKNKNTVVYADGHADFIKHKGRNILLNWFSQKILHGLIYKWSTQKLNPFVKKFYGVLPVRVNFIKEVYGIPEKKVELLVMGADDSMYDLNNSEIIQHNIRKKHNINHDDFLIVSGGRMDSTKKIEILMEAITKIPISNIKLLVFGTPHYSLKQRIADLSVSPNIINIGWIKSSEVYDYFIAADLVFFPGTHSVLWENAVGVGAPCVFKKWEGVQHIDLDGNCRFIENATVDEIINEIKIIFYNRDILLDMSKIAKEKGIKEFSYSEIAKRCIS